MQMVTTAIVSRHACASLVVVVCTACNLLNPSRAAHEHSKHIADFITYRRGLVLYAVQPAGTNRADLEATVCMLCKSV